MNAMRVIQTPASEPSDLDRLADEAALFDDDADEAASPSGAQGAPRLTNAALLLAALELVRETVCTVAGVKSPRATLSSDKLEPLADAWGAVCDKHGIELQAVVGDWLVEIRAVALTVPLVLGARAALVAEIADKRSGAAGGDASAPAAAPAAREDPASNQSSYGGTE